MARTRATTSGTATAAIGRWVLLFLLWSALVAPPSADLSSIAYGIVGAAAAAFGTWASLRLLPPCPGVSLPGSIRLGLRLVRQSALAGVDVALRAFRPSMPLRPGFVPFRSSTPRGALRDTFAAVTSLVPGTLPVGEDEEGRIIYHCLDVEEPLTEQLRADEDAVRRALDGPRTPSVPRLATDRGDEPRRSRPAARPPRRGADGP